MKVAAAQISVKPGETEANTTKMLSYVGEAKERNVDVVVFPEMSDTGALDMPLVMKTAQNWDTGTVPALKKAAQQNQINIIAGVSERTAGGVYNSTVIIDRSGNIVEQYRKTHLCSFQPFLEDQFLAAGDNLKITQIENVACGVMTCYEIRFPEIARAFTLRDAKIIFVTSAFPLVRIQHWLTLLTARAIENQIYIIACNRVGLDGSTQCCGSSIILDPYGTTVASGSAIHEGLILGDVDLEMIATVRSQFQVLKDRRPALYMH